jgi:MFS family permease
MIQATIFAVLIATGVIQLWQVYLLAVTQGLITAIDNPIRQAFIYEMVGRKDLVNAIGLNSMTFQGARIFGPALAGVVIKLIGIAPTLILNAISFIPVIGALLMMDARAFFAAPLAREGSVWKNLKEGLRYAVRTPTILSILIVVAFIGTFGYNFTVFTPLVANNILKTDSVGFGLLSAAMGIGALVAAIGTAYAHTITMRRMLISGALFSVLLGALAVSTSFALSMLLFVLLGITAITCATATNSLLQLNTPEQLRGRVLSINVLLVQGSTPIGGLFLGSVGQAAGVGTAIFLCAVLCLLGVTLALSYRWRLARATMAT